MIKNNKKMGPVCVLRGFRINLILILVFLCYCDIITRNTESAYFENQKFHPFFCSIVSFTIKILKIKKRKISMIFSCKLLTIFYIFWMKKKGFLKNQNFEKHWNFKNRPKIS